ncbi:unnamed protein product [Lepeophtheirus salmonis]|uniref:(salmon louse) hypothetical protein n=1 Tax=Lepeophtheirus salmonis TaxID=72036 RepID=A0A7R8CV33_LEPSM|nr:unnamed protein product [Lepeophtheirus salmonis]CAF2904353.1 unnamed protein product [Lepeophtheirus salmonis]
MTEEQVETPTEVPEENVEHSDDISSITTPCVDLSHCKLKIDHFEKMHSLGDERKISGAPNFRKVSGFPIYGTAQPTEDAYEVILEEISKNGHDDPDMIWYNMRQEPVIYINKIPYAPRYPNMMHENIEIGDPVPELDNLQRSFVIDIKNRLAESKDGSITIHRDSCYTENPMEREDVEESLKVESLKGLHNIFAELTTKHMSNQSYRVPVVEERAPAEECFDIIELLEKVPETIEGKRKIDRIIDICGPKGGGLQNLRECIIETKWKYDVAPEEKQVVWKRMILNFMERYFYLILFATYASEVGPEGFKSSFSEWMNARTHLRTMIEEGKDKLEWYRQVDPQKLNTLKELINAPNYEDNLTTLIKTIYEFAFLTYSDLPRGPIKNNSMRKLAAKTLLEILPPHVGQEIQKKLDEHLASPDFVTLIGLVSQHCKQRETEVTV